MSDTMNSRERVLAAMRREPVDHVPCVLTFNPLSPSVRKGHRWNFPWPEGTPGNELIRYQVEQLGTDPMVHASAGIVGSVPGVTAKTWVEGDVLHKTYSTPAGALHAAVRYNELWPHGEDIPLYSDFNIGHFVEPWLRREADLDALRCVHAVRDDADTLGRARAAVAQARELADSYGCAVQSACGMGLTGAMHLFGAVELCLKTVEDPGLVDAYLDYEHGMNLRILEFLGDAGVDTVRRNGFYETADFYGPTMLEEFLGDRLRGEASAARAAGMAMSYTVHTGVMPLLDYLSRLGIDCLFGIDIAFGGVDVERIHDCLAGGTSFFIGPSSTFHIWRGPEATRQAVRQVFEVFGRTGLILAPCVSVHSIMPWESTLAMVDEWQALR